MKKYLATKKSDYLILEFMGQAKKILAKQDIDINDERFQKIRGVLGNNLNYIGLFTKYFFEDDVELETLERLFVLFKTYSQLMKNRNINPLEIITKQDKDQEGRPMNVKSYRWHDAEVLEDTIQNLVIDNENQKFVKSFISNKYKHLINEETIGLFGKIREIAKEQKWDNVHKKLQSLLMEKIAAYRKPTQLNDALRQLLKNFQGGWDVETLKNKIVEAGGEIEWFDEFVIIADVKEKFDVCGKLGSQKWCIVRTRSYFENTYVKFPNKQYVLYDTTLDRTAPRATIGVTIKFDGSPMTAHDLNDTFVDTDYYKRWVKYMPSMTKDEMVPHLPDLTPDEMAQYGFTSEFLKLIGEGKIKIDSDETANKFFLYGAQYGHIELLEYMYNNHKVDLTANNGKAFKSVCASGHLDIFNWFVDHGVDITLDSNYGLGVAAENGHMEIFEYLMRDKRTDPSDEDNYAVIAAAKEGHVDIVKILMDDPRVDPSDDTSKAVIGACRHGFLDVLKLIVTDSRVDINTRKGRGLELAAKYNHHEIVRYLIKMGLDPSSNGTNRPLMSAVHHKNYKVIKILIEDDRVDPNVNDRYILKKAKQMNDDKIIDILRNDPHNRVKNID